MEYKRVIMISLLIFMACDGHARTPPSREDGTTRPSRRWQLERKGTIKLVQVAVGNASHVWGRDASRFVYRWTGAQWEQKAGYRQMDWISVGADGSVRGISNGSMYQLLGQEWQLMTKTPSLKCVSIAKADLVYGIGKNGLAYKLQNMVWKKMPRFRKFDTITASADGNLWGRSGTKVYQWQKILWWQWAKKPGALKDISAGRGDSIWGIGMDNAPYRWEKKAGLLGIKYWGWTRYPTSAACNLKSIAVGADGDLWVIDTDGNVGKWVKK